MTLRTTNNNVTVPPTHELFPLSFIPLQLLFPLRKCARLCTYTSLKQKGTNLIMSRQSSFINRFVSCFGRPHALLERAVCIL